MRTAAFRRGVTDFRNGRPPRFNDPDGAIWAWSYERGRQFAVLAPRNMPVVLERRLNPKAVTFFKWHFNLDIL